MSQFPLQQSVFEVHVLCIGSQVSEHVEAPATQPPTQQSPSELHGSPCPEQLPAPPAPVPPVALRPHMLLLPQTPVQQSLSISHGVPSGAQDMLLATQRPPSHVASPTHARPPLQSPPTSTRPPGGATHTPLPLQE